MIEKTGYYPLSVSTDRIAIATMRVASLMSKMAEPTERSGTWKLVEVYPAVALLQWNFDPRGYKRKKGSEARQNLVAAFLQRTRDWLHICKTDCEHCFRTDDAFDALICALIARANAVGLTEPIPAAVRAHASTEGWIALPLTGSLDQLTAVST